MGHVSEEILTTEVHSHARPRSQARQGSGGEHTGLGFSGSYTRAASGASVNMGLVLMHISGPRPRISDSTGLGWAREPAFLTSSRCC